jgi:Rrf2 family nitric oxide-sensitive transcriptional repressor
MKIKLSHGPMQITRFTDYAIRVLMMLALREKDICRTAEIAKNFSISKHHLTKVIQELNRKGWVDTHAGVAGGVQIKLETLDIRLSEIVSALEGFELAECFDTANNTCPIVSVCRLRGIWSEARDAFLDVLKKYKVKDLVERQEDMEFFLG